MSRFVAWCSVCPYSARLSGLVEDDPPPGFRISSTRTAPGVSRTGDGVQGGGRRPAAAPQERGNSGARCRRPDIGGPTDDPSREGRERDFVTLLADYDDHGTLALAEIE